MSRPPFAPAALAALVLVVLGAVSPTGAARAAEPPAVGWATAQAIERTRIGQIHAACGEQEAALRAFLDAISFDATYAPAYLALGAVYEARGDVGEAERAFSMGIDHVAGFADAFRARGRLRAHQHREADAIADFESAAALEPEALPVLRELSGAYIAARALPAALAVTRRRLSLAEASGDARAAGEARTEARALAGLVAEIDPVTAGASGRGVVRRALWAAVKKR